MEWKEFATWLAIPAVTFVWMDAARPAYEDTVVSTIACYVALANDITPLVDTGSPDAALASTECAAQKRTGANAEAPASATRSCPGTRSEVRMDLTPKAPTARRDVRSL